MPDPITRQHFYHAEATVITGQLSVPLVQTMQPQAYVKLSEQGGYLSQHLKNYRLEGVISIRSAYTQVAGNQDAHGWNSLSTSVVEGLNVLDVVTADRVVGQINTDHPLTGYVPTVNFLGTRFENLRIAGHPVKLEIDPNILGPKPANDAPYTSDPAFLERVASQNQRILIHQSLPADLANSYNQVPSTSQNQGSVACSLVNVASGSYPGQSFGHVIDVPNFGRVILAVLTVDHSDYQQGIPQQTTFNLKMVQLQMGSIASGTASIAEMTTNGHTKP